MDKKIKEDTKKSIANYNDLVYTISEVAMLLKVNRNYVYDLINNGYLKSIKLGCRKVTKTALLDFLQKYDGDISFDEKSPVTPANAGL